MKTNKISTKLNISGIFLTIIIIIILIISFIMNKASKKDSLIVNIAGLQRMLTQKMSKEILFINQNKYSDFQEIDLAINTFENNLYDLVNGNVEKEIKKPKSKEINEKLQLIKYQWQPFKEHILNIKETRNLIKNDIQVSSEKLNQLFNLSQKVVQKMVDDNQKANYIDMSGMQRMLSQKMGLYLNKFLITYNEEDFLNFTNAKNLYEKNIKFFLENNFFKQNKSLYEAILQNAKYWEDYKKFLKRFLSYEKKINQSLQYIYDNNLILLQHIDESVWLFTINHEKTNHKFLYAIFICVILALLVIFYAFMTTKNVIKNLSNFVHEAKELKTKSINDINSFSSSFDEEELKEVVDSFESYVQKVNFAMQNSQNALKNAKKSLDELTKISHFIETSLQDTKLDEQKKQKLNKSAIKTEDIAIQSTENLIYIQEMLKKLKSTLNKTLER